MIRIVSLVVTLFNLFCYAVEEQDVLSSCDIYTLTSKATEYSVHSNGCESADGVGVHFSFEASEDANYVLILQSPVAVHVYKYDDDGMYQKNNLKYSCNSGNCKIHYPLKKGEKTFDMVGVKNDSDLKKTFSAKMERGYVVSAEVAGKGKAIIGGGTKDWVDSVFLAGDTVAVKAESGKGSKFEKWEKVSGNCSILDAKLAQTKVVVEKDCRIRATFVAGEIYPITSTPKKYTPAKNHSADTPDQGVWFSFVAPSDGWFAINYEKDGGEWSYFYRYRTSGFVDSDIAENTKYSYSDTVSLSAGDSLFYLVKNEYAKDSLMSFSMSYKKVPTVSLSVESSSPQCSTDTYLTLMLKGTVVQLQAFAREGYRADGWTVLSGSNRVSDSSAFSIRDTIDADTKIRIECRKSSILDITDKKKKFVAYNDYYDKSPSTGMRFRYKTTEAGLFAVRFVPDEFYGMFRHYASDSTFKTYVKSNGNTSYKVSFFLNVKSAGEKYYFSAVPYSSNYWKDSLTAVALPAGTFKIQDAAKPDTLALGDTVTVSAALDSGMHFEKWTIVSGKGSFIDSTLVKTGYVLEKSSVVKPVGSKLPLYQLTSDYKGYTYKDNGTFSSVNTYGVRAFLDPEDAGMYLVQFKGKRDLYLYNFNVDSKFVSFDTTSCTAWNDCRQIVDAKANEKHYFQFVPKNDERVADSVWIRAVKTVRLRTDTSGVGRAFVGKSSRTYDSTYIAGDTVDLRATTSHVDFKFNKWSVVSGSCKILEPTKSETYVVPSGNCTVKAEFVLGKVLSIESVATKYTYLDDYYSRSPIHGVRFSFVAPTSDRYAFAFRSLDESMVIESYESGKFDSYKTVRLGVSSHIDERELSAGDSVFFIVKPLQDTDTSKGFWLNYSRSSVSIKLTTDGKGTVEPDSGYPHAWSGTAYPITAIAESDYHFDKWTFASGAGVVEDSFAAQTMAYATKKSTIKALFKQSSVYELTKKEKTYNFQKNHYSDSEPGTIRFMWNPPDTNSYMIVVDSIKGSYQLYERDSLFNTNVPEEKIDGKAYILIKGTPGKKKYLTVTDSVTTTSRDVDFTAKVISPKHLFVESKRGRAIPSGNVYLPPDADTLVYAVPYGGYVFDSWTNVEGSAEISDPKNVSTRVKPESDYCSILANYVLDSATIPEVKITNLDFSNHPGICAHVSVVDKQTGRPIVGLDSSDFRLVEDDGRVSPQAASLQSIGGVSVALVVDESGSMAENFRMEKAKEAIRRFINEMGPYDRTAIVGFKGYSNAKVRQPMTSDKKRLLQAVDSLNAEGDTNIGTGTKLGVHQVVGETNPTAVIVFSDGENGSENVTTEEVVELANILNTTIYSIALESSNKSPLADLAEGTGGSFTYAQDASELTDIYMTIRGSVQERYILCYNSPDADWDGDSHTLVVKTNFMDKEASDSASWNEDFTPPKVELTKSTWSLVGVQQTEEKSLEISVYVTTKDSITNVSLFMRPSSLDNIGFLTYGMTHVKDSLWKFVIPDSLVTYPGIDFYVVATGAHGLMGWTPSVPNPFKQPYTIPVKNKVPDITMQALNCIDMKGDRRLRFNISDKDGIHDATLYYRDSLDVLFYEMALTQKNDLWEAKIPSNAFTSGIGEFYVYAVDGVGGGARWHQNENAWIPVCGRNIYISDIQDTVHIVNMDSSEAPIIRTTETIGITVRTENFSDDVDTVHVKLSCLASGDVESDVVLVEKKYGFFETRKALDKDERSPKKDDGKISCVARDTMVAEYMDPLYKTYTQDTVYLADSIVYSYRFMEQDDFEDLDSVQTGGEAEFRIRVTGLSESIHEVDTLDVLLFTDEGDSLWVRAVETGKYSSTFDYRGSFQFVKSKSDLRDSVLDGVFDLQKSRNRVKIQSWVRGDKSSLSKRDSLIVYSGYVPADYAEIYDIDMDGTADSIRIKFISPLSDSLKGIDTLYWNMAGGEWRSVSKKDLNAVDKGIWYEARLEEPFEYGVTAADAVQAPYLKLASTKDAFPQNVEIRDRIGAVPVKALKRPGIIPLDKYMENSEDVPPDTLVVTMSERIKNEGDRDAWKKLFTYSLSCEDSAVKALNVKEIIKVDSLGINWKMVLGDHFLRTEDCFRTNPEASYVDDEGNSMGRGGVKVTGSNGELYLYEVVPVPVVNGVGKKAKWIAPGDDEWSSLPDSLTSIRVASVLPYKASIVIYDGLANVVTSFKREFGYKGEMKQKIRGNDENNAKTGFLTWNMRSKSGRLVGTGVYLWRIDFKFKDGHSEYRLVKMGVKRKK